jgi:hypothetical protein
MLRRTSSFFQWEKILAIMVFFYQDIMVFLNQKCKGIEEARWKKSHQKSRVYPE